MANAAGWQYPFQRPEFNYMRHPDSVYLQDAQYIQMMGENREDRTGTGTISMFGLQSRYDLTNGFPLLTTKKLHIPSIVHELLWFLNGDTNIKYLQDNKVRIWDADYERVRKAGTHFSGELGPIYGKQWRDWEYRYPGEYEMEKVGIDQIKELIESLKHNPASRRHIVSAWNVGQLHEMALPPCHIMFQAYVSNDGGLSLQMYQRSADWFLGVPFNIASYSLLTHMIAQVTGLYAKEFIHVVGDAHLYLNHLEQIEEQMQREPKELPTLWLNPDIKNIDDFTFDDIKFEGYEPHPLIKGRVSVG